MCKYVYVDLCLFRALGLNHFSMLDFGCFLYESGMAVKVDCLGKQKEGLLKPKIEHFKVALLF